MRILGREFGRSRQITTGQAEPETEGGLPIIREKAARIVSTPSGAWVAPPERAKEAARRAAHSKEMRHEKPRMRCRMRGRMLRMMRGGSGGA